MSSRSLPEFLLARAVGYTRANAIYGDLVELAATRGTLWFWLTYTRTLIALTWRSAPIAFLLAFAVFRIMFAKVLPWIFWHRSPHLNDPGLFGWNNPHMRMVTWNLSLVIAQTLIFALPFVIVRFGLRDRLTQLTCCLFIISMAAYSFRAWVMDLSDILIGLTLIAALILPLWRKPLIIVASMVVVPILAKVYFLFCYGRRGTHHIFVLSRAQTVIADMVALAIAALVCSTLHRWLIQPHRTVAIETHCI